MTVWRPLLRWRSPAGAQARLSVLIFHRVHGWQDPLAPAEVDAVRFDRMCGWLARWFNVVPLDVAVHRLDEGSLPERALAITFDDGYADNHDVAMPILRCHGLCATFFVATGFLDGGRMWNDTIIESIRATALQSIDISDLLGVELPALALGTIADRRHAVGAVIGHVKYLQPARRQVFVDGFAQALQTSPPGNLMMTSAQVQALRRAGMQIGAHTVTHPILKGLPDDAAEREIADSKRHLESLINERIGLFAYPNGKADVDFDDAAAALVRRLGFDAAVTTQRGVSRREGDRFRMPRFTPWESDRFRFGLRLWQNLGDVSRSPNVAGGAA